MKEDKDEEKYRAENTKRTVKEEAEEGETEDNKQEKKKKANAKEDGKT